MKDVWNNPIVRKALAVGALLYMVGATSWSMPAGFPLKSAIDPLFSPVFRRLGLWQGWDMFAPNPRDEDIYVSANIEYVDGSSITDVLSRMSDMPYGERYAKERWRKFMNDNMRLDSNKEMWNDTASWIARRAASRNGMAVRKVELYRHWRKCALPGEKINVLNDTRPFNQFKFHTYETQASPAATPRPMLPLNLLKNGGKSP